jgi:hypothetical protein
MWDPVYVPPGGSLAQEQQLLQDQADDDGRYDPVLIGRCRRFRISLCLVGCQLTVGMRPALSANRGRGVR